MDEVDITAQAEEELLGNQCTKTMNVTLDLDQQCDEQIDHFIKQADKNLTMDLEEQDGSIDGESDDLNTEGTMEQYYSRMLKQDKSLERTAILHGNIETLLLKLNTVQK